MHDWLIYAFVRARGLAWIIDDHVGLRYRQHSDNVFGANVGRDAIRSRWRRLVNGWYFSEVHAIADFTDSDCAPPIQLLREWTTGSRLELAFTARRLRRSGRDSAVLAAALVWPGTADWRDGSL